MVVHSGGQDVEDWAQTSTCKGNGYPTQGRSRETCCLLLLAVAADNVALLLLPLVRQSVILVVFLFSLLSALLSLLSALFSLLSSLSSRLSSLIPLCSLPSSLFSLCSLPSSLAAAHFSDRTSHLSLRTLHQAIDSAPNCLAPLRHPPWPGGMREAIK